MMERFLRAEGVALSMPRDNIDTDAILPVRYMKAMDEDFGKGLFGNLRYNVDGSANPDFDLNKAEYATAKILVVGDNFGCGSSREHAVWALLGYGFRCVIAKGFGDIFYNNCFRAGLLPISLSSEAIDSLSAAVAQAAGKRNTVVDLKSQTIVSPDGARYEFEIEAMRRRILLDGLDGIGVTLLYVDAITSYQERDRAARPWVYIAE
jgi:3-isopropylmalate/(R)-2-methylmalate dehydratase small subunit